MRGPADGAETRTLKDPGHWSRVSHRLSESGSAMNALAALVVFQLLAGMIGALWRFAAAMAAVAALLWLAASVARFAMTVKSETGARREGSSAAAAIGVGVLLTFWVPWRVWSLRNDYVDNATIAWLEWMMIASGTVLFGGLVVLALAYRQFARWLGAEHLVQQVQQGAILAGSYIVANAVSVKVARVQVGEFSVNAFLIMFAGLFIGMFALLRLAAVARGLSMIIELKLTAQDNAAAARRQAAGEDAGSGWL